MIPAAEKNFQVVNHTRSDNNWLEHTDPYTAAMAFVRGDFDVEGSLVDAVRAQFVQSSGSWRSHVAGWLARVPVWHLLQSWAGRGRTARQIQYHYDRSNDFYRQFLDSRMVYSCAYFRRPGDSLEEAQVAKLDHVCRKLRLEVGERFLDIGCGWGALLIHAAARYGVLATGCTLSHAQYEEASAEIARLHFDPFIHVLESDYRDVAGKFDKIASVGMVEHVGKANLARYFETMYRLLAPGGLFLNHGITRPAWSRSDARGLFIARRVFPGGQVLRLSDMIEQAECAGFEVLDVEGLRPHYALTCRFWLDRLQHHRQEALLLVDEETYRTWELYLAGCVAIFEDGGLGIHQLLLYKRGAGGPPLTRESMYGPSLGKRGAL